MSSRSKPVLLFDGECGFCRRWICRWRFRTWGRVRYQPLQHSNEKPPYEAVKLIEPEGAVTKGAHAVFRALASAPGGSTGLWFYRHVPGFAAVSEAVYRLVAGNRIFFSQLSRWAWGERISPPSYELTTWIFFRLLGLIYLAAFWSFGLQVKGLVGENGILPAGMMLDAIASKLGAVRYAFFPTLAWFNASDGFLQGLCVAGAALSVLLVFVRARPLLLFALWALYLSVTTVGGDFMGFQWESLLLEAGFVSIFMAGSRAGWFRWLLRLLLFRLMFSSGMVKLMSGDPSWHSLTALKYHYETQPLPTWIGWYAHQLPAGFQAFSTLVMFAVELALPFFVFFPRRPRMFAFFGLIGLQVIILLTGNYCYFNLLTIALCILLVEDHDLRRFLKLSTRVWLGARARKHFTKRPKGVRVARAPILAVFVFVLLLQAHQLSRFFGRFPLPQSAEIALDVAASARIVSGYGLFAVMTTTRNEIVIEGSNDRDTWRPYEFNWKPGALNRRPAFVAPHQPRLDWQMWFAALSDYESNPWFRNLLVRLLQGSPEVTSLFAKNPFPDSPPRYVRAELYEYHFTNIASLRSSGNWWHRERRGEYAPVLSLK